MKLIFILTISCLIIVSSQKHISVPEGFRVASTSNGDKKITIKAKDSVTFQTKLDKNTGEEYFTGLNIYGQKSEIELALRFDYGNLLLPGVGFTTPVVCDQTTICKKSDQSQILDYFGTQLQTVYPTQTYLNLFNPSEETLKGIDQVEAFIVDNAPETMKRGIVGFGFLSELYKYLKKNFEVKQEDGSISSMVISYTAQIEQVAIKQVDFQDNSLNKNQDEEYTMPQFTNGNLILNKMLSPIGCSASNTVVKTKQTNKELSLPSSYIYKLPGKISYTSGNTPKIDLNGQFMLLTNGPLSSTGVYFSVVNRGEYIKSLNQAICKNDICTNKEDLSKVPTISMDMTCDPLNDRIAHMNMQILGSEYAYFDGKQIQYLIGELPVSTQTDKTQYLGVGRLFFSKYEFFVRTNTEEDNQVSAGFGDIKYEVNKKYWYMVTGCVTLGIILSLLLVAILFSETQKEMNSSINIGTDEGTIKESSQPDWDAGINEEYAKV